MGITGISSHDGGAKPQQSSVLKLRFQRSESKFLEVGNVARDLLVVMSNTTVTAPTGRPEHRPALSKAAKGLPEIDDSRERTRSARISRSPARSHRSKNSPPFESHPHFSLPNRPPRSHGVAPPYLPLEISANALYAHFRAGARAAAWACRARSCGLFAKVKRPTRGGRTGKSPGHAKKWDQSKLVRSDTSCKIELAW